MKRYRIPSIAAVALVLALALAAAACDETSDRGRYDGVVNSVAILDSAGVHEIDESVNTQQQIPATARTTFLHLETVLRLTRWPAGTLTEDSNTLADLFRDAAAAMDTDTPDLKVVGGLTNKAHEALHDFTHNVWDYLESKAGVHAGHEQAE